MIAYDLMHSHPRLGSPEAGLAAQQADYEPHRRILLVDANPIVRTGLMHLLQSQDFDVSDAVDTGEEAFNRAVVITPDAVIVDVELKGCDGLDFIKRFQSVRPQCPLLVFSNLDQRIYADRVMRAGARGFISKCSPCAEIVEALNCVLAGNSYLSRGVRSILTAEDRRKLPTDALSLMDSLSNRELEVFRLIGHALITKEIAQKLHLSIKTIETYRDHLKRKLGLRTGVELVKYALQWAQHETEIGRG